MISSEDLRFFAVVATTPTLASAARALGVTAPAVTQRLQSMEHRLRVRLLDRGHGRIVLTEEGRLLAEQATRILSDLQSISALLQHRSREVSGHLRVVAPFGFGRRYVVPVVTAFRKLHPGATLEMLLTDRPRQYDEDAWDLIVHVGELPDSGRILRHLAANRRVLCASPSYLAAYGMPQVPKDLHRHVCIALRENEEDVTLWRFTSRDNGSSTGIRVTPALLTNDGEVAKRWAMNGLGVTMRSEWDVADEFKAGTLVRLLPQWQVPDADVVALLPSRKARAARTEYFLEMLAASLSPAPWRH